MDVLDNIYEFLEGLLTKMLDPFVLCCGFFTGIIMMISYYFLFMHNREEEFDRAFPREALELINEKKAPVKAGKNNKKDKKKQNTPDDTEDERVRAAQPQAGITRAAAPSAPPAPAAAKAKVAPETKKQPQQQQPQQPRQPQQQQEQVQQQQVQQAAPQEPQPARNASPKEERKRPAKVINPKDLDQKKVMSRLAALTDLEEGYVQFLASAFRDSDNQKNNLTAEVKALRGKIDEAKQKIEKLQKEKTAIEQREKQEQSQKEGSANKIRHLQDRESELNKLLLNADMQAKTRMAEHTKEINNSRDRIKKLEAENSKLADTSRILTNTQKQLQFEQNRNNQMKREHEAEIKRRDEQKAKEVASIEKLAVVVERAEKEIADAGQQIDSLKNENAELTKKIAELQESFDAARLALENQTKHDNEKDSGLEAEVTALKEEISKLNAEKQLVVDNHARLEELIKELNNDISEFHAYKDQQEALIGELKKREEARNEEIESLKEKSQAKEAQLIEQLEETKLKLSEVKKAIEEEKSRVVEIPKNEPEPPVVEEVFELKKTQVDLASAPSTSGADASEVQRLTAENATLRDKNTELRQRNTTIQEKVEAAPDQLLNERKRVVAELQKLTNKQFKTFNDEEAYNQWFRESITDIQKRITASQSAAPAPAAPAPKVQKQAAPVQQAQPQNEGVYFKALQVLSKELDLISSLVDKTNKEHQEEVARLRAQIPRS